MNLIFDVDGTLTESRQHIDELFKIELEGLARENNIYIATGSDYSKTADQLGTDFLEKQRFSKKCQEILNSKQFFNKIRITRQ